MSRVLSFLILALLLAAGFSIGVILQPQTVAWNRRAQNAGILDILFGDGRRIFANHFFVQADVSLHSGYYPSIFDQPENKPSTEHTEALTPGGDAHEEEEDFLGPPRDWIDGFGRHFKVTKHTHLEGGKEREILPWLKISAELDPQRVDTYTVAAYWLRQRLGKVDEAERFLHQGLRNNPDSYEILFELGKLYYENRNDVVHARNVWELAFRKWLEQEPQKEKPDKIGLDGILMNLANLEGQQGNLAKQIEYLEKAKHVSPHPEALQEQIDEARKKLSSGTP
jgi:tetratricopeptide (TPR) repeat protein